jgi:hypothetical protein
MIFCKKILDLEVDNMNIFKIVCLKILCRIYSRHVGGNVGYKLLKFAEEFYFRYSVPIMESFVKLLMDTNNSH